MKQKPKKDRTQYEIIYDRYNRIYFMAHMTYVNNKPIVCKKAEVSGASLWLLSGKIEKFFKAYLDSKKIKRINQRGKLVR